MTLVLVARYFGFLKEQEQTEGETHQISYRWYVAYAHNTPMVQKHAQSIPTI